MAEQYPVKALSHILAALPDNIVIHITGDKDVNITAPITENAADVQAGGIFLARKGASVDGHDFIPQAIDRGVAALVGQRPPAADLAVPYIQVFDPMAVLGYLAAAYYDFPSRKMVVIGVTGTNGKTTTSTLIHSILKTAAGGKCGYISTIAADLGDATADTGLHVTTPGAPQIQAYLAQMVANELDYCVLEMTSHGLAQGRVNGVDLDVAVLTNITHEHLDYHGTFEKYRAAKGKMFALLKQSEIKSSPSGNPIPKISVINNDDANADFFAAYPADKVLRYGIGQKADLMPVSIDYDVLVDGDSVTQIKLPDVTLHTALPGSFNVSNILAAVAATRYLPAAQSDQWWLAVEKAITSVNLIPGRMERIQAGQAFTAIVDFAHTPDALEKALAAAKTLLTPGKRVIAVFGSAGLRDVEKRRLMAEVSARMADMTVLTAEDPRTEPLEKILEMMAQGCISQGGVEGETFIRIPDRGEAIYQACQMASADDIVIVCGKGHEQSMCFGTIEYPWDDREALRSALAGTPLRSLPTANMD